MLWNGEVLDATGATVTTSFKADAAVTAAGTRLATRRSTAGRRRPPPLPPALTTRFRAPISILSLTTNGSTAATTYTRRGCAP